MGYGRRAVPAQYLLKWTEYAGNSLIVMILVACKDGPFGNERGGTRAPGSMWSPSGALVAYSAGTGETAVNQDGTISPYALTRVEAMVEPRLRLEGVFKLVRQRVKKETGKQQTPWENNSSLKRDFYFVGAEDTPASPSLAETRAVSNQVAASIHTVAAY